MTIGEELTRETTEYVSAYMEEKEKLIQKKGGAFCSVKQGNIRSVTVGSAGEKTAICKVFYQNRFCYFWERERQMCLICKVHEHHILIINELFCLFFLENLLFYCKVQNITYCQELQITNEQTLLNVLTKQSGDIGVAHCSRLVSFAHHGCTYRYLEEADEIRCLTQKKRFQFWKLEIMSWEINNVL